VWPQAGEHVVLQAHSKWDKIFEEEHEVDMAQFVTDKIMGTHFARSPHVLTSLSLMRSDLVFLESLTPTLDHTLVCKNVANAYIALLDVEYDPPRELARLKWSLKDYNPDQNLPVFIKGRVTHPAAGGTRPPHPRTTRSRPP
jgi:hypothetical protein